MHEFRDLGTLTKVAAAALLIYMVTRIAMLATIYWADSVAAPQEMGAALGIAAIASGLFLLMLVVCLVIVGRWIYRASANAHALSDEMTISPGWAVGWYFVPVMNLFKPYQAMREIWLASHFRGNWHGEPRPGVVGLWWGLWIVVNIIDNVSTRLDHLDADRQLASGAFVFDCVAGLLNVALCLVLISLMRQVARAQSTAPYEEAFA